MNRLFKNSLFFCIYCKLFVSVRQQSGQNSLPNKNATILQIPPQETNTAPLIRQYNLQQYNHTPFFLHINLLSKKTTISEENQTAEKPGKATHVKQQGI